MSTKPMTRKPFVRTLGLVLLAGVAAGALAGCGKRGLLETPPPLYGDRAKARYQAEQQQKAQDAADAVQKQTPAADQPDNTPPSKRDIKAPEQQRTTVTQHPIDGSAPSPFGAQPSMRPPGR